MTDNDKIGELQGCEDCTLWRAVCFVCPWRSTVRTSESEADLAMVAHFENVHGLSGVGSEPV